MITQVEIETFAADVLDTITKLRAEIERLKKLADEGQMWRQKYEAYQDTPEGKAKALAKAKADSERLAKELDVAKKRAEELTPKE